METVTEYAEDLRLQHDTSGHIDRLEVCVLCERVTECAQRVIIMPDAMFVWVCAKCGPEFGER